jgi:hypothetical protein
VALASAVALTLHADSMMPIFYARDKPKERKIFMILIIQMFVFYDCIIIIFVVVVIVVVVADTTVMDANNGTAAPLVWRGQFMDKPAHKQKKIIYHKPNREEKMWK